MSGLEASLRAAAVTLLTDYAADAKTALQVYPARPRSIYPPTAFVDAMREQIAYTGQLRQRTPFADVIVIHGLFDSAEAANQRDAFIDGFLDWTTARPHAATANSVVGVTAIEDLPAYVPDWLPPDKQVAYYATQVTLEGYGE